MTLREYMKRNNLTPEDFAPLVDATPQSVRRWLRGERIVSHHVAAIVRVTLGAVSAAEIIRDCEGTK